MQSIEKALKAIRERAHRAATGEGDPVQVPGVSPAAHYERVESVKPHHDVRPRSDDDACAACGRSKTAPAGRIPVTAHERAGPPHDALFIERHYGDTEPCPLPHGG